MTSNDSQPDLQTTWNMVLKDEDCVRIRKLLCKDGSLCPGAVELLQEGWKGVDLVQKSLPDKPAIVWKGRTALHVAARRGDVKLVKDILAISYPQLQWRTSMASKEQGQGDSDPLISGASTASKEQDGIGPTGLKHILEVIDDYYELDALGMAIVNGNMHIVHLLKIASLRCGLNPYDISQDVLEDTELSNEDEDSKVLLSNVIKEVVSEISETSAVNDKYMTDLKKWYQEDCDFNFDVDAKLDMHLFFHFTCSTWLARTEKEEDFIKLIRKRIISRLSHNDELLRYLLVTLKDGQGRTALHVAVDSQKVADFLEATEALQGEKTKDYLNVRDSANRTPLYRAAAKELSWAVWDLLKDERTDVHAEIEYEAYGEGTRIWGKGLDIDKLSWKNGFRSDCVYVPKEKLDRKGFNNKGISLAGPGPWIRCMNKVSSTALHVAIIHKHEGIVDKILERLERDLVTNGHPRCSRRYTWPVLTALQGNEKAWTNQISEVNTMQLTLLVGSIPILQRLLKAEEKWKKPDYFSAVGTELHCPSFLLAAAMGNPGVIKAFLESKKGKFDYNVRDSLNNTALHYVLQGKHIQFHPHMVDYVGCHHVYSSRWNNDALLSQWLANPQENPRIRDVENDKKADLQGRYNQRRGSINLLLEAGIDMWAQNVHRRTTSPDPDAPKDFVEWWYEKAATLTTEEQRKQNDAANAISVVAALVATASYMGPLQPPLGYNENSLQVNVSAVKIFVVCNSLSFYFALAAIMCALLPSLPLQNESFFRELDRTRNFVALAVTCLFPSIIFVLVAFAAGYIAVIPDNGLSYHGLIIATTVVGGFVCLYVMIWFIGRLLKVLKNRFKGSLLGLVLKSLNESIGIRLEGTWVAQWLKQTSDVMKRINSFPGEFIRRKFHIQEW